MPHPLQNIGIATQDDSFPKTQTKKSNINMQSEFKVAHEK